MVVDKLAGFEGKDIWFKKGRLGVENRTTRACDVVRSPSKGNTEDDVAQFWARNLRKGRRQEGRIGVRGVRGLVE